MMSWTQGVFAMFSQFNLFFKIKNYDDINYWTFTEQWTPISAYFEHRVLCYLYKQTASAHFKMAVEIVFIFLF